MKKENHNLKLVSHIAVLAMVVMLAVTATFSWYNRSANEDFPIGGVLKYERSGNINGSGGNIATYAGTESNGKITYADTDISGTTLTTEPGAINYFKTVITDISTGDSLISVYLENFTTSLGSKINIGIFKPEKTYKTTDYKRTDNVYIFDKVCLIDNVPIKKGTTAEIYWFVEIPTTSTKSGTINLGTLHLVYG